MGLGSQLSNYEMLQVQYCWAWSICHSEVYLLDVAIVVYMYIELATAQSFDLVAPIGCEKLCWAKALGCWVVEDLLVACF